MSCLMFKSLSRKLSAYNDNYTLSLDNFYFFFLSDTVSRTSDTMLNRRGESGHPCLVPEFSRKAFSFLLLSIMLAVGSS